MNGHPFDGPAQTHVLIAHVETETDDLGLSVSVTARRASTMTTFTAPTPRASDLPPDVRDALAAWLRGGYRPELDDRVIWHDPFIGPRPGQVTRVDAAHRTVDLALRTDTAESIDRRVGVPWDQLERAAHPAPERPAAGNFPRVGQEAVLSVPDERPIAVRILEVDLDDGKADVFPLDQIPGKPILGVRFAHLRRPLA